MASGRVGQGGAVAEAKAEVANGGEDAGGLQ